MVLSKYNFKLYSEMVMLPQIPQIWGGSGALKHGWGFLGKPDPIFLEMVALFWVKMGEFLAAPESYLLPLLYLRDI